MAHPAIPAASPQPGHDALLRCAPALFVLLWSTGFIGARLGLPHAEPFTFLFIRFALVTLLLAGAALALGSRWPGINATRHLAVSGLLLHGVYLGGVFTSIAAGVEAGVAALIVCLQPLLVAAAAARWLGERTGRWQWLGLALGLAGVTLVVARKLEAGLGTPAGMALSVAALVGITLGTIYQKRHCARMHLVTGSVVQFAAATVAVGLLALALERRDVNWTGEFVFALAWLVLVLSFGAISLLYLLLRHGGAARVSTLFFLVPAVTAAMTWWLFDEQFGGLALLGLLLTVSGVALVNLAGGRTRR